MKAMVYTEYGTPDVLQYKDVEKPTPKDDEVLVKIYAVSLNKADWHLLNGSPFLVRMMAGGMTKPKHPIIGSDIAGRIEAVGKNVTHFKIDDEVYGDLSGCGWGGFAEYACTRESALVMKPATLSFEQAAAVPMAAVTALQGLRDMGKIQAGQKVLINGASGGVGTFAIQLAKHFGAEVTAVCSTKNVELARSLGADHVIDYTQADFTGSGQTYDLILAANGSQSLSEYKRALKLNGTLVVSGGSMGQIFQSMLLGRFQSMFGSKKLGNLMAHSSQSDLIFLKGLLESGKIAPVIDRCYPLKELAQAFRYLAEVHARGKVVLSVVPTREGA